MSGILIVGVLLLISIILTINKKSDLSIILFILVCGPLIKFGDIALDSAYLVIIYLLVKLLLSKKKISWNSKIKRYAILVMNNLFIYLLSTLIFSNIYADTIISIFGFLKILILILLIFNLYSWENKELEFNRFIKLSLLSNFIASTVQMIFQEKVVDFFKVLYSSGSDSYYFVSNTVSYRRTFGLFSNGTLFAVFLLLAITYIISCKKLNVKAKAIYLIIALACGLMNATKTFIIGFPIIMLVTVIYSVYKKGIRKISRKTLLILILSIFLLPLFVIIFNSVVNFLQEQGIFIKYYLSFLSNPIEAFTTRYNNSGSNILLTTTYEVIKEYLFTGVGFNSIKGEFLGDSTYVLALHNGGIISLITIIIYFIKEITNSIKIKEKYSILYFIIIIITGFGISNLFNTTVVIPFYIYFAALEVKENE